MIDYSFAQLPDTAPMNRLPIVIDEPGDYLTRSGRRVTIHQICMHAPEPNGPLRHSVTAFEAKGAIWRVFRGKDQPMGYEIWHLSGRILTHAEMPMDIVAKAPSLEGN